MSWEEDQAWEAQDGPPTPTAAAWAAGFVDGEGYLSLDRVPHGHGRWVYRPRIRVGNIRIEPLRRLQALFGGTLRLSRPQQGPRRPLWEWQVRGRRTVEPALRAMRPYLTVKREEADELLAFIAAMRPAGGGKRLSAADQERQRGTVNRLRLLKRRVG